MDVKSTLKVFNQADYPGGRGVTDGQTYQRLIGWPEVQETDRVRIGRATYTPGTYEQLHWHPIEACYYVISGHATVRNLEGDEFEVGPGSMISQHHRPRYGTSQLMVRPQLNWAASRPFRLPGRIQPSRRTWTKWDMQKASASQIKTSANCISPTRMAPGTLSLLPERELNSGNGLRTACALCMSSTVGLSKALTWASFRVDRP